MICDCVLNDLRFLFFSHNEFESIAQFIIFAKQCVALQTLLQLSRGSKLKFAFFERSTDLNECLLSH